MTIFAGACQKAHRLLSWHWTTAKPPEFPYLRVSTIVHLYLIGLKNAIRIHGNAKKLY
jgi:hypothetical protein